jgi:pimeloyl-ACP methyl ester carboxylesterase
MIHHRTRAVDGVNLFYREAGPADGPVILLLHGWPSSSHMFRNLMPLLAHRFRLIAPDYPGFGFSDAPSPDTFGYTFDRVAGLIEGLIDGLGITKVSLYVQDYGGPVGFRIAAKRPELIRAIVVQNAVAHLEGVAPSLAPLMAYWENQDAAHEAAVRGFLTPETTKWQYLEGAAQPELVAPESYTLDAQLLARPGNDRIQLAYFLDYRTNPGRFAEWQAYLRTQRPPMLVVWGKNDPFFTVAGAEAFVRDNPNATLRFLDGGHFAIEEHVETIAAEMIALADRVKAGA